MTKQNKKAFKILSEVNTEPSRKVEEKDLKRIAELLPKMTELCYHPLGLHTLGALAIAHCQVETEDHLRFFVTKAGYAVINPVLEVDGSVKKSVEGCMNYPQQKPLKIERYKRGFVSYKKMSLDSNGEPVVEEVERQLVTGKSCFILQHEIDHFNCVTIFDRYGEK